MIILTYRKHSDVTWAPKRLKSEETWLFLQQVAQAHIKEDIKDHRTFVREIHQLRFPSQRASNAETGTMSYLAKSLTFCISIKSSENLCVLIQIPFDMCLPMSSWE